MYLMRTYPEHTNMSRLVTLSTWS